MRKLLFAACLCLVSTLSACAFDEGADVSDEAAIEHEEMRLSSDDPETAGGEFRADVDIGIQAGCAHIRWCDEPNSPWGTICAVDNWSCSWEAIGRECAADARAVCGRTVPPVDIRD